VYEDDSPSTSSTVPCGRLGDLSATTGFALDVGHATNITSIRKTDTRLLSYDAYAAWVLWDATARTMIARGRSEPWPPIHIEFVDTPVPMPPVLSATHLASLTTTDAVAFALEIRSAVDGALIATVTMPGLTALSHFGFASDGSYVWAATKSGISAWSTSGALLAQASGDYEDAGVSAAPGELRIGLSTRNTIEKISTANGASTSSAAFQGTFHSWFVDGARFLTTISNTVRVYSGAAASQENIFTLPTLKNLTGQGDHVWTFNDLTLDIYALSDTSAPAASFSLGTLDRAFPASDLIGIVKYSVPSIDIIQLGSTITRSSVDVPTLNSQVFTADEAGDWALGGGDGELRESTDLNDPLSCGRILSIARADDGTTAVGTAAGGILLFELTGDSRQYLGTLPFPSSNVELSRDGLVLAAAADVDRAQYQQDYSLRVFSLPDRSVIKTWPYTSDDPRFFGFSMSSEGNRFGHQTGSYDQGTNRWSYTMDVRDLNDDVSLSLTENIPVNDLDARVDAPLRLSADGTLVAVASGNATNVYDNGVLVNALSGKPLAWFDDDRLLVELDGHFRVYDSSGQLEPSANLKDYAGNDIVSIVSATEIYSEDYGAIYSLTSGEEIWSCGSSWLGTAAAGYATFVSAYAPHKLVFDTY
jgi:hypothetical protein